jgi:Tol biopolymer transport system component
VVVIRLAGALAAVAILLLARPVLETSPADAEGVTGELLMVLGRQVQRVSLGALRPRPLTQIAVPANAEEVAAAPDGGRAVVVVSAPAADGGPRGADLVLLDLASGQMAPLLTRSSGAESLVAPAWLPGADGLLFQRDDQSGPLVAAPGQEIARHPSRIEAVSADGSGRRVLVADGRHPGPAPDGLSFAFARGTPQSAALLVSSRADGAEREVVPLGRFPDLAYPRFSPDGATIAFVAPQTAAAERPGGPLRLLEPAVALAHGIPWDVWLVNPDGTGLRRLAQPESDEPSVDWSPDGTRVFVYGGTGSWVVSVADGAAAAFPRLTGYGVASWVGP